MTIPTTPPLPQQSCLTRRRRASATVVVGLATCAILAGIAIVPAVAVAIVPHHKGHDLKLQVELLEDQWRRAQLTGDVATMDKLLSDDYIGISMNGQVHTKAQQLERLRTRRVALTKLELSEMKVKLIGSIAIVTSRAEVEGTSDGVSVRGIYRYTRVYQRLDSGAWKITSFEATRTPQPKTVNEPPPPAPPAGNRPPTPNYQQRYAIRIPTRS
jgi:ketosteroid isomerase-like protein